MPLLSFDEALRTVQEHCKALVPTQEVAIESAVGHVLAEDVIADDYYPRFDNSSVDGYAIATEADASSGKSLKLAGTAHAGGVEVSSLLPGQALRVFTGAPIPSGTYGVVMQEEVEASGHHVLLHSALRQAENIRYKGSEIFPGQTLLSAGTEINVGGVGVLALAGKATVSVTTGPKVAIVSTGDELVDHRCKPEGPQIRDTSGPMLTAMLSRWGASEVSTDRVADDLDELREILRSLSVRSDLIVVSGGVSVGGRDYLPVVIRELGQVFFHGVSMRPGKPVLFGKIEGTRIFGLPGNPASAFVTSQLFVREAMRLMVGRAESRLNWVEARFDADHAPCGREDFVRVGLEWRKEELWAHAKFEQASFGLKSLSAARGLARLPAERPFPGGERCRVLVLD